MCTVRSSLMYSWYCIWPSCNPTPYPTEEDLLETASVSSADSDDFFVVIPDCFDVSKPLPGYTPPVIQPQYPVPPPILSHDVMTRSSDSHITSSIVEEPKPTLTNSTPSQTTPPTARREYVPQRVTLKNVRDARMYRRPFTVATGLVNTMSDLVSRKVKIAPPRKPEEVGVVNSMEEDSSSDEEFEVRITLLKVPTVFWQCNFTFNLG